MSKLEENNHSETNSIFFPKHPICKDYKGKLLKCGLPIRTGDGQAWREKQSNLVLKELEKIEKIRKNQYGKIYNMNRKNTKKPVIRSKTNKYKLKKNPICNNYTGKLLTIGLPPHTREGKLWWDSLSPGEYCTAIKKEKELRGLYAKKYNKINLKNPEFHKKRLIAVRRWANSYYGKQFYKNPEQKEARKLWLRKYLKNPINRNKHNKSCSKSQAKNICKHKRQRESCIECDGARVCEHKRQRSSCKDCCPTELRFVRFCHVCGERSAKGRKYGTPGVCAKCDKSIPERTEHIVKKYILGQLPPPSANDSQLTGSKCGESKRRADLLWVGQNCVVQVEIDENEHKGRTVSCELGKIDSSKWGLHQEDQCKPMYFIRFNPDGCQTEEEFHRRCDHLVSTIQQCCSGQSGSEDWKTHVIYMYYSENNKHIQAAATQKQFRVYVLS